MYFKNVTMKNEVGLHARNATFFVQAANHFKSSIHLEKGERQIAAKSLLGVLALGIIGGDEIRIIAEGTDEVSAVDSLVKLIESEFSSDVMNEIV